MERTTCHIRNHHLAIQGDAGHWDFREDDDNYFEQPGLLFNLMDEEQQQLLFENTARNMTGVEKHIQIRHIKHCYQADPAYGEGVAKAIGIPMSEVEARIKRSKIILVR